MCRRPSSPPFRPSRKYARFVEQWYMNSTGCRQPRVREQHHGPIVDARGEPEVEVGADPFLGALDAAQDHVAVRGLLGDLEGGRRFCCPEEELQFPARALLAGDVARPPPGEAVLRGQLPVHPLLWCGDLDAVPDVSHGRALSAIRDTQPSGCVSRIGSRLAACQAKRCGRWPRSEGRRFPVS